MGCRTNAETKLDQLLREPLGMSKYDFCYKFPGAIGLVGQFSIGNQPSLHVPYIYNYLGAPGAFAMPGDNDGGGMSAFVTLSVMGLFPVTPGMPVYKSANPVFDRIAIRLRHGKTFFHRLPDNSVQNKYIQSIKLNGQPRQKVWISHADITNGGTLGLEMGGTPNKELGAGPADFPPSAMNLNPMAMETFRK